MQRTIRQIEKAANKVLADTNTVVPYVDVIKIAKSLGIQVKAEDLGDEVSGILAIRENGILIGYNKKHGESRQRFTIAHEIGHFVLGHGRDGLFIDTSKQSVILNRDSKSSTGEERQEVEANAFAAALLMPGDMVKSELQKMLEEGLTISEDSEKWIEELSIRFKVSKSAMSFRIGNLRLFDEI